MRIWKQGVIGKLTLVNGTGLFIKLLKYPLAGFYQNFTMNQKFVPVILADDDVDFIPLPRQTSHTLLQQTLTG